MDIAAENLQKSFLLDKRIEVKALKDITLSIASGETVAVIGPSGAGKSTLLHVLGLMDRPSSGRLALGGRDLSSLNDAGLARTRREKIGFLFQLHYLLPDFTVWENVLLPVWDRRAGKEKEAVELLERLGLSPRLEHMPAELSGGEQQRVALARALVHEPELLLADEPTGNLDRETGEKVEEIIFSECKKRRITLVLVTHNGELASKAGRIIKMRDGRVISGN
ncbi:MAG: ABC transporter ATP-binding protein [Endomicrobiales bacterium]